MAIFAARPTAMYHSLGAYDQLPLVFTRDGHGGVQKPRIVLSEATGELFLCKISGVALVGCSYLVWECMFLFSLLPQKR